MKKIVLSVISILLIFSGVKATAQESDDDFLNMIGSALQDSAEKNQSDEDEVGRSYIEGEDDNKVQPTRNAQIDDTIEDPYKEKDKLKENIDYIEEKFDEKNEIDAENAQNESIETEKTEASVETSAVEENLLEATDNENAENLVQGDFSSLKAELPESSETEIDNAISNDNDEFAGQNENSSQKSEFYDFSEKEADKIPDSDEIVQSIYGIPEKKSNDDEYGDDIAMIEVMIPPKQKPKSADNEKLEAAKKRDEDNSDYEKKMETLKFGTPGEISSVVDDVVENDDPRFIEQFYDLFYVTSSNDVRSKIIDYFAKNEDPCLSDYVVEILDDPYDVSSAFASKCMEYASKVKCKEAAPAFVKILEGENEDYFNAALSALGKTGGTKEAKYLAHYLERDDLEVPMRQALMRTLGQMNAVETWDQIVEIAQDEDENGFVRQYAAEAIGNMKKDEGIPILVNLYENGDPNMREYCIKGLLNFPESDKAKNLILQGIRDEHVKVRLQSIKACREMNFKDAVDYLIYRAKNDNENAVKKETYPAIAELDTKAGNDFLVERITDEKAPDSAKNMAAEALLKFNKNNKGVKEINHLALNVVEDDRRKPLRKGIGRLLAKYPKPEFGEVCSKYISSKDADTCGLGIDMYKSGRYDEAKEALQTLADAKVGNVANRKRARKLLGMDEDLSAEKK